MVSGNVVANGGFEDRSAGWGPGNGGDGFNFVTYEDPAVAHSGSSFMASNTTTAGRSLAQTVSGSFIAGGTYTGSLWVRSSIAEPVSGALVLWATGGGLDRGETRFTAGPTWEQVQVTASLTGTRTELKLEAYENTPGVT
jgi:hypothetical protein